MRSESPEELLRALRLVDPGTPHVLVVDDHATNRTVLSAKLESWGLTVSCAASAAEALSWLDAGRDFDLGLLDYQMPEMNGYEATAAIRALGGAKAGVPIIAMTANVLESELERSQKAGMDGFVPKPFRRTELLEMITRVLRNRR